MSAASPDYPGAPAQTIYPGLLIFITVIAVNFDALQDVFDPKT